MYKKTRVYKGTQKTRMSWCEFRENRRPVRASLNETDLLTLCKGRKEYKNLIYKKRQYNYGITNLYHSSIINIVSGILYIIFYPNLPHPVSLETCPFVTSADERAQDFSNCCSWTVMSAHWTVVSRAIAKFYKNVHIKNIVLLYCIFVKYAVKYQLEIYRIIIISNEIDRCDLLRKPYFEQLCHQRELQSL